MGRTSSGGAGSQWGTIDGGGKGTMNQFDIKNVESLKNVKDPQVYKELKSAISRYEAVMGVRDRNVKLADMPRRINGVHVTTVDGKSDGIYLNKKLYNKSKQEIIKQRKDDYASGWSTKTNKPIAHTLTHELAHATWNDSLSGRNQKAAGQEVRKLYDSWRKDKQKSGYGRYANTNINEFWAETVTKAVHGTSDKYTKAVKAITKKYKL